MSGLDSIKAWILEQRELLLEISNTESNNEAYELIEEIFKDSGRSKLDDVLLDDKKEFLEFLEKQRSERISTGFEEKEEEEPLFMPTEEPFTPQEKPIKRISSQMVVTELFNDIIREQVKGTTLKIQAKNLGINYSTFRSSLSRARKRLSQ